MKKLFKYYLSMKHVPYHKIIWLYHIDCSKMIDQGSVFFCNI